MDRVEHDLSDEQWDALKLAWGGCASSPPARGYQCQTLADTCLTNLDCTTALPACAFSSATKTRACHEGQVLCP